MVTPFLELRRPFGTPRSPLLRRPMARMALLAVVQGAAFAAGRAAADAYVSLPLPDNAKQLEASVTKVSTILRADAAPSPDDLKTIDDFFNGYLYPTMTAYGASDLGTLADQRVKLFRLYLGVVKNADTRTHLNDITWKKMASIAVGNYHPAVRYNATLVLGQLDKEAAKVGAGNGPPVPLPEGTKALLTLLERDDVRGVPVPTSVKIAALVGLARHTQLGADPQFADGIAKGALAVLNRKDPPEDASAAIYDWVRSLAAQVLINQSAKGVSQETADALAKFLGNSKADLDDRCRAAGLLTGSMFSGAQGVKFDALAMAIGTLAQNVLADEAKKAGDYVDKMTGGGAATVSSFGGRGEYGGGYGGRGGRGGGEYGGMGAGVPDTNPHYEKRRMLGRIMAVVAACDAIIAGGGSDELKQRMTALRTPIMACADAVTNKSLKKTEIEVAQMVMQLAATVDELVASWSSGEAPAGDKGSNDKAAAPAADKAKADVAAGG